MLVRNSTTLTIEQAIQRVEDKHGVGKIDFTQSVYIKSTVKTTFKCNDCGLVFEKSWNKLLCGVACRVCARKKSSMTLEDAVRKVVDKYGDVLDFSESEYIRSHAVTTFICKDCCTRFERPWTTILHSNDNHPCPVCSKNNREYINYNDIQSLSNILKINFGDTLSYNKVNESDVMRANTEIEIACSICNHIQVRKLMHLLDGRGCRKCAYKRATEKRKCDSLDVSNRISRIHGDTLKVNIPDTIGNNHDIVEVLCNVCNHLYQTELKMLLNGSGCQICGRLEGKKKREMGVNTLINRAIETHGPRFTYTTDMPNGLGSKITLTCRECENAFTVNWKNHIRGEECPKCNPLPLYKHTMDTLIAKINELHPGELEHISNIGIYEDTLSVAKFKCNSCLTTFEHNWNGLIRVGSTNCCPTCHPLCGYNTKLPGLLYYIRINDMSYYKIGITNRSVRIRFNSHADYKKITVIATRSFSNGQDAYNAEQAVLKCPEYSQYRYVGPDILHSGNTEIFTKDVLQMDKEDA